MTIALNRILLEVIQTEDKLISTIDNDSIKIIKNYMNSVYVKLYKHYRYLNFSEN